MTPDNQGINDNRRQSAANSNLQATEAEVSMGSTAAGGDNAGTAVPAATGAGSPTAGGAGLGGDVSDGTSGL